MKIAGTHNARKTKTSTGYQSPFLAPEREKAKDKRLTTTNYSNSTQPAIICPSCGGSVNPTIHMIIGNHRVGGGRYSVMRGDALCLSAGTSVKQEKEGELNGR